MGGDSSTSSTTAAAVAVVLLQPAKLAGKRHEAGSTVEVTAQVAEDLLSSGSAAPVSPDAEAADQPAPKPGSKRQTSRTAASAD